MTGNNDAFGSAPDLIKELGVALDTSPKRAVQIDTKKYQAWLDDPALDDAQKEQIIEALWKIILCFVDLGFGISPLQQACGKVAEIVGESDQTSDDVVVSGGSSLTETFNEYAAE